jgi:hypothetical protein
MATKKKATKKLKKGKKEEYMKPLIGVKNVGWG